MTQGYICLLFCVNNDCIMMLSKFTVLIKLPVHRVGLLVDKGVMKQKIKLFQRKNNYLFSDSTISTVKGIQKQYCFPQRDGVKYSAAKGSFTHAEKQIQGVIIKFESFLHMFFIYEYILIIFCQNKQYYYIAINIK